MELKLNGDINAGNIQIGETNTMTITYEEKKELLQEKDWEELEKFLSIRLTELTENRNLYMLTKKGLDYAEKRDEKGFKGFLVKNKDNFFCNVLSEIASSGLVLLLSRLSLG